MNLNGFITSSQAGSQKLRIIFFLFSLFILSQQLWADPLPSWNKGVVKKNIIQFVQSITDRSSPHYVEPNKRIATFDNDGTLWVEQPVYTQFIFAMDRVKALAPMHPEWKSEQPFSAIIQNDKETMNQFSVEDLKKIASATHTDLSIDKYHQVASTWFNTAKNPRYQHLYKETIYQPMIEVIHYLKNNGFKVYIVTGGGQEFVRSFSKEAYDIDSEYVIGTVGETKYTYVNNKPVLMKTPELLFLNDKAVKPEAINYFIGKKPIIAFGNSDGDKEMLEWTQSNTAPHLMVLIHHDDAIREYAYDTQSKIGTFSDALKKYAIENNWNIVSMKNDWNVVFPFELKSSSHKEK